MIYLFLMKNLSKKRLIWFIIFLTNFIIQFSLISAIRINELESNPTGTDTGNEWLELFSEQDTILAGWTIKNNDNDEINLSEFSVSFSGYFILNLKGQWLDNTNEKIIILYNNTVKEETILFSDSKNDDKTWQYCNGNWQFLSSTKNQENSCQSNSQSPQEQYPQESQNQTNNIDSQTESTSNNEESRVSEPETYIKLEYNEKIERKEEFEVKLKAYNLKSENYDVKIYLVNEEDDVISETYNEESKKWRSSNYFVEDVIKGPGNKTETFMLRIDKDNTNYIGDSKISAKIRESGATSTIAEFEDEINIEDVISIVERNQTDVIETEKQSNNINYLSSDEEQEEVIILNKKRQNIILTEPIYKSKTQYIKEYSLYGFAVFSVLVIIFLIIKKSPITED